MTEEELKEMVEFRVSATKMRAYLDCPAFYYYKYVMGVEEEPSVHLLKGSAIHEILEDLGMISWKKIEPHVTDDATLTNFLLKKANKGLRKYEKLSDIKDFCAEYGESWKEVKNDMIWILAGWVFWYVRNYFMHVRAGKDNWYAWSLLHPQIAGKSKNRGDDKAIEVEIVLPTEMWINREWKNLDLDIECPRCEGTRAVMGNGGTAACPCCSVVGGTIEIPVKLKGIIDVVREMDGHKAGLKINYTTLTDYKTSKVFQIPISDEYIDQMMFYAHLWELKTGELPTAVMIHYIRTMDLPTLIPLPNVNLICPHCEKGFEHKYNEEHVMSQVRRFVQGIRDRYYPANPSYQWCNYKNPRIHIQCDYWDECHKEGRYSGHISLGTKDPPFYEVKQ